MVVSGALLLTHIVFPPGVAPDGTEKQTRKRRSYVQKELGKKGFYEDFAGRDSCDGA